MNFKIPLLNVPQRFEIALGGKDYVMTCKYNDADLGGWVLDFDDAITQEPIAYNIPLITGVDVLQGLEYLGFNGQMYIFTDGDQFAVPTLENLGIESNLYFQTELANG